MAKRAVALSVSADSLVIVANNHFQGKEVANILQLKAKILGRKLPVPPGLKAKYPELNEIAVFD